MTNVRFCGSEPQRGEAPAPNRSGEACTLRSRHTKGRRSGTVSNRRSPHITVPVRVLRSQHTGLSPRCALPREKRSTVTCSCADCAAARETSPCASPIRFGAGAPPPRASLPVPVLKLEQIDKLAEKTAFCFFLKSLFRELPLPFFVFLHDLLAQWFGIFAVGVDIMERFSE